MDLLKKNNAFSIILFIYFITLPLVFFNSIQDAFLLPRQLLTNVLLFAFFFLISKKRYFEDFFVLKNKNKNDEILLVIAYIVGSEVFLRTTHGNPVYEYGKYIMLFFTSVGFFYNGLPKLKNPYWIYLLLFLPGLIMSVITEKNIKNELIFVELGPMSLGFLSLYTFKKDTKIDNIRMIMFFLILPIIVSIVFLFINYSNTDIDKIFFNGSNFYFSGGFGPNQMASILGLGFSVLFLKILIEKSSKTILYVYFFFLSAILFRGLLTFSRGGIITGFVVVLSFIVAIKISRIKIASLNLKLIALFGLTIATIYLANYITQNKIFDRYTFIDSRAIKRSGRIVQLKTDVKTFKENPVLGIGVKKSTEKIVKENPYLKEYSSHIEVTRMLSEQGILGLISLIILLFYPINNYRKDLKNVFILPFFMFWILTINHSATRIAAPLFIYSLTLLKLKDEENDNIFIK